MTGSPGVVVIGGGPNALVAAFFLAKAGARPLVLEQRDDVGGGFVTGALRPGVRSPTLAHAGGPLASTVAKAMRLESHGLSWIEPAVPRAALSPDGRAVVFARDPAATHASISGVSAKDAAVYPLWQSTLAAIARTVAPLLDRPPADIDTLRIGDLWSLATTGRRFKQLSRADAYRLLQWPPMPIADLVSDWFEAPLIRAAIAARATIGVFAGPQEAGTTANLLLEAAARQLGAAGDTAVVPRGGPGALSAALAAAARAAGATIRTRARVKRILADDSGVQGVALEGGDEIRAGVVLSGVDPRRTLLHLVDPSGVDPDLAWRIGNIRMRGTLAKVNLALRGLPACAGLWPTGAASVGSAPLLTHIGPDLDYLQRAFDAVKYGRLAPEPWLEISVPSLLDDSLVPQGGDLQVMSIYAQHVPPAPAGQTVDSHRGAIAEAVMRTLSGYFPGIGERVEATEVVAPEDLATGWGLTGGHIFHGEHALDQLHLGRPLLGSARYRTMIAGLYLCGAGTHPGGWLTGLPGYLAAREVIGDRRKAS